MTYKVRWRRALVISSIIHIFFFAACGLLDASLFAVSKDQEQYIELDLVSEYQVEDRGNSSGPSDNSAPRQAFTRHEQLDNQSHNNIVQTQNVVAKVEANSLEMVSAEIPASALSGEENTGTGQAGNGSSDSKVSGTGGHGQTNTGSPGGNGKGSGIAPPSILSKVEPNYPEQARSAGLQGTVILKIQILENGRPGSIIVTSSSGHELLDNAAVSAVKEWRFVPAKDRESGQKVICYTTLPVAFRLN